MKTSSKRTKDNVEVIVEFTSKEIDDAISKKYKELANKYKFPGFRAGKAPRPIIDNAIGKDGVRAQVTDDLVNKYTPLSIDDQNLFPCGRPNFGDKELSLVDAGKTYKFTYKIDVVPEFELDNYDKVEFEMPNAEASDDEIDTQIDQFRQHYFTYADAPASTKADGDATLSLKIKATDDDGNEIESLTNDALNYHLGSNFLPNDFEDKLIGCKKGDKKSFKIAIPKEPTVYTTSLVDKTKNIDFDVEIKSIQTKVLPKVDDEWVKTNMGFETVAELRKQVAEQVSQEKARMAPVLKENKALDVLAKRLKGKIPESVCEQKEAELLQDFFTQLQQQGLTFDTYLAQSGITSDKFKEDVKKQAKDVAAQDMALDAYGRKKGLKATDKEIEEEFKHGDPEHWKELYKDWRDRGELYKLRRAIIRMKAAKDLVENANIKVVDAKALKKSNSKTASKSTGKKTSSKSTEKKTSKSTTRSSTKTKAKSSKSTTSKTTTKK